MTRFGTRALAATLAFIFSGVRMSSALETAQPRYRGPTRGRSHRGEGEPGLPGDKLRHKAAEGSLGTCHGRAVSGKQYRHGREFVRTGYAPTKRLG